jgi:hypothetical protein
MSSATAWNLISGPIVGSENHERNFLGEALGLSMSRHVSIPGPPTKKNG